MSDGSRKARQRQRREAKRRAARRQQGVSRYARAAEGATVETCLIDPAWREKGITPVLVLCRLAEGGYASVSFLVDSWCAGLKDAYCELDVTPELFRELVERYPDKLEKVGVEEARRLVAGGVRLSHELGFRLPQHYERAIKFVGGVGEWQSADLSGFGFQGKWHWMGTREDLRKRLIGSVEDFLSRPDVVYTFALQGMGAGDDLDDEDDFEDSEDEDDLPDSEDEDGIEDAEGDEDEDDLDEPDEAAMMQEFQQVQKQLEKPVAGMLRAMREWCTLTKEELHPLVPDLAAPILMCAAASVATEEGTKPDVWPALRPDLLEGFITAAPADIRPMVKDAVAQISRFWRDVTPK